MKSKSLFPFTTRIFLLLLFVIILLGELVASANNVTVTRILIDLSSGKSMHEVNQRFLSYAIDSFDLYEHWKRINLKNERLQKLALFLKPAYLRIGGTAGDAIKFSTKDKIRRGGNSTHLSSLALSKDHWGNSDYPTKLIFGQDLLELDNFVKRSESKLIFSLNALLRKNSAWDSSNAMSMLSFMQRHGFEVAGWQFGNEPDRFPTVFGKNVSPKQLAQDFIQLKKFLQNFKSFNNSFTIGPDLSHVDPDHGSGFLRKFLKNLSNPTLSKMSFHQYYFDGRNRTLAEYMNPVTMDVLREEVEISKHLLATYQPGTPLWIGETSSSFAGGTPGISNTFVDSFMWVDKLGLSAQMGVDVVFRETLIGGWYGLLNFNGDPTPDYFVSLIYKKLVGRRVLEFQPDWLTSKVNGNDVGQGLRLYKHCSKVKLGSVVLFGLNVDNKSYRIRIKGDAGKEIHEYLLSPSRGNLTSTTIRLNGRALRIGKDNKYPDLPSQIKISSIIFPAYTVGFWHMPLAHVKDCYRQIER